MKKGITIVKVWLLMVVTYLLTSLVFDYCYYRIIDIREAALMKLFIYPFAFTCAALWLLRSRKSASQLDASQPDSPSIE